MEEASTSEKNVLLSQGYSVMKKIGQGSYAKVYLCETKNTDVPDYYKKLACKIIDTSLAHKEFVIKFFPRELEVLMKIKHPNIIHIFGIFRKGYKFFIMMRLAENKDLLDYVVQKGEVPEERARFWIYQISSALAYIHSKDIVHRDLKCENVLLTQNYNVKVCDFGFAKTVLRGEDGEIEVSHTFCGSLAYTAPEVLEMKPYNPKQADIWSLGVIMYVILSKSLPYQEKTAKGMVVKQKRRLQFVGRTWELVSSQSKITILKLLDLEPKSRWTAEHLLRSPWICMDSRLVDMNLESVRSQSVSVSVEKRRLIAQMKASPRQIYDKSLVVFKEQSISKSPSYNFFTRFKEKVLKKEKEST